MPADPSRPFIFVMKDLRKVVPPKREILKGIWLSFYYGAKIGVIGANGAGKSSLLRIMAGLDQDYLGEAFLGKGYTVGFLSQEPQLDPAKTVLGNVQDGVAGKMKIVNRWNEIAAKFAEEMSRNLVARFLSGEIDEVDLVNTHFKSALHRTIIVEPYLPLGRVSAGGGTQRDYLYEPSPEGILERIVPYFLAMRLYMALAESSASEHGARMVAMGSATKNANEMIQTLTLHMNRTRQATITRELVEIVAGAEALK